MGAGYIYDSAASTPSAWQRLRQLGQHRSLVRLLVTRDLRIRYKRSAVGIWWTLLGPLLEMAVLAVIFSEIFRFSSPRVPYVVYLLSGIIVAGLFRNVIIRTANSLLENRSTLSCMRIPAEVFSVAAALEVGANFLVGLLPLLAIMVMAGASISPAAPLLLVPTVLLIVFALGLGVALAPAVARFNDTLGLAAIGLSLLTYLAPIFYPIGIVPDRFRFIVDINPLTHFLDLFRDLLYGGGLGSLSDYLICGGSSAVAVVAGFWVFEHGRVRAIALL